MNALTEEAHSVIKSILGECHIPAIEAARGLYFAHLRISSNKPDKREVEAELKSIRSKVHAALEALKDLDRTLESLSMTGRLAVNKSMESGAALHLKDTLYVLSHLSVVKYLFPPHIRGRALKRERAAFILSLARIFECATGNLATIATQTNERAGDGYGLFNKFVHACAGDLDGFLEEENSAVTSAIRRALKVTEG